MHILLIIIKWLVKCLIPVLWSSLGLVSNGQAKIFLQRVVFTSDGFLNSFRKSEIKDVLFGLRMFIVFFVIFFLILVYFEDDRFRSPADAFFILSLLLINFAISWFYDHKESFKRAFLQPWVILFILGPILLAMLPSLYLGLFKVLEIGGHPSWLSDEFVFKNYWSIAVIASLILFLICFCTYLLMCCIAFIVLGVIVAMVFLLQKILDFGFKINKSLMYLLLGIIALIVECLK